MTISGDSLAAVWADDRLGNFEVYFRERAGETWGPPVRLTTNAASSTHPAIGRFPGEVRVAWEDDRTGHAEIWMKRRILGAWTADSCITCDPIESSRPALDHTGEHLVWEEMKDGNREIYYRQRLQTGAWQPEVRISDDASESSHPSVASPNEITLNAAGGLGLVLVVWQDDRHGNWEIYSRYCEFGGWGPETRVSFDDGASRYPSAIVEWNTCTDVVFPWNVAVWQDDRVGNEEIFLAEGGVGTWGAAEQASHTATSSLHPSVSTSNHLIPYIFGGFTLCPMPVVVWEERFAPTAAIIVADDLGDEMSVPALVSAIQADASFPSVAVQHIFQSGVDGERTIEVVWSDRRDGNAEVYEARNVAIETAVGAPVLAPGPKHLTIEGSRPNPFTASTTFTVVLDRDSDLEVRIVDAAGRVVSELFRGTRPAGRHPFTWNARGRSGRPAVAGTYFVAVRGGGDMLAERIVLVR